MNQRSSNYWPYIPLLLIAGLSFWLNSSVAPDTHDNDPLRHDADYWVDNFSVKRFDRDGRPLNTLSGQKMTHFPDDDTTLITNPKVTFFRQPTLQLSAALGQIGNDGKEITLTNNVLIHRDGSAGGLPMEMRTQRMVLFPEIEELRVTSNLTITQGKSVVSGSAMNLNNKTGISVLNGPVTATFHRANPL
ncbi:MAG: LPS export ABC transporter periplasmic protein LptC [Rhodocyclaceae bacterium]|nr:LPS export ABC transporter periplasmic protein LptC [Rhodocyclaceae bacterium]MBL0074418.1 LPS export ABC transporter periplasmic protein LptC [Rhodocyclaceae bacterium]MBP6109377.1 LPS export ABC transporter periplasmic protein LptC [Rhodocyclaceae bacterium]MBP6279663.1 LPS export ABC transporter periplasmic protein LptC [Rhodocyclaceae bacterium]